MVCSLKDLKINLHIALGHDCNKFLKLLNADQNPIHFLIYGQMLIIFRHLLTERLVVVLVSASQLDDSVEVEQEMLQLQFLLTETTGEDGDKKRVVGGSLTSSP